MFFLYILKETGDLETMKTELVKFLEMTGRYSDEIMEKLMGYMHGIISWNEKVNLTNLTEEDEFIEKHYIDSLLLWNSESFKKADKIIDVGTGGGFPGVPLAILYPEKEFVLLDSLKKRLNIIDSLTDELGINNVITFHGRAEDAAKQKEMREAFDLCVSRAVANLTSLSELCIPFVKVGGYFVAYKGPGAYDEAKEAENAINMLGGKLESITVPEGQKESEHTLITILKTANTPEKYPRKAGDPLKKPLK